jgi:hypothetical protein
LAPRFTALLVTALAFMTGFITLPLVSPGTAATAAFDGAPVRPRRAVLHRVLGHRAHYVWCWTAGAARCR